MGCEIVIVVLCGLPGSGKSCLTQLIKEKHEQSLLKTVCCVVCYDRFLHKSRAEQLIAANDVTEGHSKWKAYRECIVAAVESLVCELLEKDPPNNEANFNTVSIIAQLKNEIRVGTLPNRLLFVIDDNMYFKSMRYEYYKLARKYNIGFCQIHVRSRLDVTIERNDTRLDLEKVKDTVIYSMVDKFEPPDPIENSWESMSITTDDDDNDHFLSFWQKVESVLQMAFDNPVASYVNDEEEKAASREECSRSILHQVDKVLRKLVSNEMKKNGGTKSEAKRLNVTRQILLNDMKTGQLGLNEDVKHRIECGQIKDDEILLYQFLNEAFQNKLTNKKT